MHQFRCIRSSLCGQAARRPAATIAVGLPDALPGAIARLRRADPAILIVAIMPAGAVEHRVQALRAGADACYGARVESREITAVLDSLARRLPGADAVCAPDSQARTWCLAPDGSVLSAPNGRSLPLSPTESALLARLLACNGQPIRRDAAAAHVWPQPGGQARAKPRSIDVLVSRLRRKAQRLQIDLPLMAVRRLGYVFMSDMALDDAEAVKPL